MAIHDDPNKSKASQSTAGLPESQGEKDRLEKERALRESLNQQATQDAQLKAQVNKQADDKIVNKAGELVEKVANHQKLQEQQMKVDQKFDAAKNSDKIPLTPEQERQARRLAMEAEKSPTQISAEIRQAESQAAESANLKYELGQNDANKPLEDSFHQFMQARVEYLHHKARLSSEETLESIDTLREIRTEKFNRLESLRRQLVNQIDLEMRN